MSDQRFEPVFGLGEKNDAYAQYFIGQSYRNPLTSEGVSIGNITFEPGCRNDWHIHHASSGGGQVLLCTDGSGWHQVEGQEPQSMVPGTVVQVAAGVKHWHGAKSDSWFAHVAVTVPGEDAWNEWLEPVTDEEYLRLPKDGDAA